LIVPLNHNYGAKIASGEAFKKITSINSRRRQNEVTHSRVNLESSQANKNHSKVNQSPKLNLRFVAGMGERKENLCNGRYPN